MPISFRIAEFALGVIIVLIVVDSALRTFVLPRGSNPLLSRAVFFGLRVPFRFIAGRAGSERRTDGLMALYAPSTLFALPLVWLVLVVSAFTLMFHAEGGRTLREAFIASGSSVFTLGFIETDRLFDSILAFTEAALGLVLLSLVIAYVPTIYGAFSRREVLVAHLGSLAGTPPDAFAFLERMHDTGRLDGPAVADFWERWQYWFAEVEETHTSLSIVAYFRSPDPHRSWVTAAGTVLDSAALTLSTVDLPWQPMAGLCILTGTNSLRRIATNLHLPFDPGPAPDSPIAISRDEFDVMYARLAAAGIPVKSDPDQAWRDFAGWRVNYDEPLLGIAAKVLAPEAPWTADRAPVQR